jgi:DNA-binding HxlR family transcriptional regulator
MTNHTVDTCTENADRIDELHEEIRRAIAVFGGKWKLEILWLLNQRVHRFNELRRAIPGVTQHMLTLQLRELENDGLVSRTVFPEVPPRVEYRITDEAQRLKPVFEAIFTWSRERTVHQISKVA